MTAIVYLSHRMLFVIFIHLSVSLASRPIILMPCEVVRLGLFMDNAKLLQSTSL